MRTWYQLNHVVSLQRLFGLGQFDALLWSHVHGYIKDRRLTSKLFNDVRWPHSSITGGIFLFSVLLILILILISGLYIKDVQVTEENVMSSVLVCLWARVHRSDQSHIQGVCEGPPRPQREDKRNIYWWIRDTMRWEGQSEGLCLSMVHVQAVESMEDHISFGLVVRVGQ